MSDWLANGPIAPNPTGAIALTNGTSDSETITLSATTIAVAGGNRFGHLQRRADPERKHRLPGRRGRHLLLTNSLAGSNSLVVGNAGGGTVVLVNNFTGPTTITAGTLQLGTGNMGQDGSLTGGTITNNGVLAYNLYGNQTYSGVISGSGGVTMAGNNSTLTLTGSNNYTGPTTVSAGILNYQNALAFGGSSAITVAVGATVQVQGGIGGGSQPMTISGTRRRRGQPGPGERQRHEHLRRPAHAGRQRHHLLRRRQPGPDQYRHDHGAETKFDPHRRRQRLRSPARSAPPPAA